MSEVICKMTDEVVKNKPILTKRSGRISIAKWPKNGNKPDCKLQSSWFDKKKGEWVRTSIYLYENELDDLVSAVKQFKSGE